MAPEAFLYATKIFDQNGRFMLVDTDLATLVEDAYTSGARISTNSWGKAINGVYDPDARLFDALTRDAHTTPGNQQMLFVFAAGNDGPFDRSINSPGSAKNVITVGATENCDHGMMDGCGIGPEGSDSLRDIIHFSSRGPLADGRLSPTLVAPGTHVTGAASDAWGFSGLGVCGRLESSLEAGELQNSWRYYPARQSFYTWASGTSFATPLVAGAATLLHEFYLRELEQEPSPALIKAALIASAKDTADGDLNNGTGQPAPSIPNMHAGWGRASIRDIVLDDGPNQFVIDQTEILQSGDVYEYEFQVVDPTIPLKVVLVWTDAPAAANAAKALVNDLDLELTNGIDTWRGNVFVDGYSVPGGEFDRLNNTEAIYIQAPQAGVYTVRVRAHEIMADAIPGEGEDLEQDFALVILNGSNKAQGNITFNKPVYKCNDEMWISVAHSDRADAGQISVTVTNVNQGASKTVMLTEVEAPSGIFQGRIQLTSDQTQGEGDGFLYGIHDDQIEVTYNNGTADVKKSIRLDCEAPFIVSRTIESPEETLSIARITANEPVTMIFEIGTSYGNFTRSYEINDTRREHEILLTDLEPCRVYMYRITMRDRAGNEAVVDEGGNGFVFQTPATFVTFMDFVEPAHPGWTHGAIAGTEMDDAVRRWLTTPETVCWSKCR